MINLLRVDQKVKMRGTYVPDSVDRWTSFAPQILADLSFKFEGDCDDFAQTALHLLYLEGVPKRRLWRAIVQTPDARKAGIYADHMVGIYQDTEGRRWIVGDTFGPPVQVRDSVHKIRQTSRFDEGTIWRFVNIFDGFRRATNTAAMSYVTSTSGKEFIKNNEGCRLLAYDDKRPNYKLKKGDKLLGTLTIGFGHTGPDVFIGQIISKAQADLLFNRRLPEFERAVKLYIKVPISQSQFDALVDFCYNVGVGQFRTSTLVKKINAKAPVGEIQAQFRRWVYSGGQLLPGLVTRRESCAQMWENMRPLLSINTNSAPKAPITPAPVVDETPKAIQSMTLWSQAAQLLAGLSIPVLQQILSAANDLKANVDPLGLSWLATPIGLGIAAVAGVIFARRFNEIMVNARR